MAVHDEVVQQAAEAAKQAERQRVVDLILRLQSNATCRTVKKTCQAILDRVLEDKR